MKRDSVEREIKAVDSGKSICNTFHRFSQMLSRLISLRWKNHITINFAHKLTARPVNACTEKWVMIKHATLKWSFEQVNNLKNKPLRRAAAFYQYLSLWLVSRSDTKRMFNTIVWLLMSTYINIVVRKTSISQCLLEFEMNRTSDGSRKGFLLSMLAREGHPAGKFTTGKHR